jgi:hypothetical protein
VKRSMDSDKGKYAPLSTDSSPGDDLKTYFDEEDRLSSSSVGGEKGDTNQWNAGQSNRGFRRKVSINIFLAAFAISAAFLLGVVATLAATKWTAQNGIGRQESGLYESGQKAPTYPTDYPPARDAVELEMVRFSGSAYFDDAGEPFFHYKEGETRYFGKPSEDIDIAWGEMLSRE